MKALMASLVFVGGVAAGLLLLAGHFLATPMRETRLGTTPPTTLVAARKPPEIPGFPTWDPGPDPSLLPTPLPPPTPSPTAERSLATVYPARNFSAVLPTQPATPVVAPSLPTRAPAATPSPSREGCDPAYPDEETCIPPGPPFDQGCAITEERRFTVLPPDPQRLDHDKDGVGCEPVD